MTLYDLLILAAGLSLFLYGMIRSEKALKLLAGARIRHVIERATRNRVVGLITGFVVTLGTQSSSATAVMLVGFTAAGLITLQHSIGIILGTSIATTLTVQMFAWNVAKIAPALIAVGFFMTLGGKNQHRHQIGYLTLALGLIFFGMGMMAQSVAPLRESAMFREVLRLTSSPFALLLIGAVFTAIVQSSAAVITLVIALSLPGENGVALLSLQKAIPLILGANIGTAATALIAASGSTTEGRQVAWAHAIYKTLGALVAFPLVGILVKVGEWSAPDSVARQIANIDTLYNVTAALIFLPLTRLLARLTRAIVHDAPGSDAAYSVSFINRDFGALPYLALAQARKEIVRMSGVVTAMLEECWAAVSRRAADKVDTIKQEDDKVDFLQERITPYLSRLSEGEMRPEECQMQTELLTVASEVELVGDIISKDLVSSVRHYLSMETTFSADGLRDISEFYERVRVELYLAIEAFTQKDDVLARKVLEQKAEIDTLHEQMRLHHFERLRKQRSDSLETSTLHLDILEDLRRVNSHAARICAAVLGTQTRAMAAPI